MRPRSWFVSFALVACFAGSVFAEDKSDAAKPGQLLCPVSGKPAKLTHKVVTDDGPVFFCCDGCPKKFEAEPAKYKEQVAAQRAVLAHYPRVQEKCPMSGKPIDKAVFVENEGQKVYFCCKDCAGEYKADPAKYKAKVAASLTYMDLPTCPISGEPVDVSVKTKTDDGPVYFCCAGCEKKYKAEPAKYSDKVAAQRKTMAMMPRVQVTCPLSGKPVSNKQFVEKDGQKVYFCCADCKGKFEKDPEKYSAKMEGTYSYQTLCPVMNEEVSAKAYVELEDGRRIYMCCPDCAGKLKAHPEKYNVNLGQQQVHVTDEALKAAKPAT